MKIGFGCDGLSWLRIRADTGVCPYGDPEWERDCRGAPLCAPFRLMPGQTRGGLSQESNLWPPLPSRERIEVRVACLIRAILRTLSVPCRLSSAPPHPNLLPPGEKGLFETPSVSLSLRSHSLELTRACPWCHTRQRPPRPLPAALRRRRALPSRQEPCRAGGVGRGARSLFRCPATAYPGSATSLPRSR